jgi:putative copper export protein
VDTMEKLAAFLHVLAVVVWMGGVLTLNVLLALLGRGQDRAAQGSLLRLSDRYGRAVIAPAAALTLLTGSATGPCGWRGVSSASSCPWPLERR